MPSPCANIDCLAFYPSDVGLHDWVDLCIIIPSIHFRIIFVLADLVPWSDCRHIVHKIIKQAACLDVFLSW
jgi:hypothetical protein